MARWHNIRVRGDLYEMVAGRAQANRRSVAQMTDVLLTQALMEQSAAEGVQQIATSIARPSAAAVSALDGALHAPTPDLAEQIQEVRDAPRYWPKTQVEIQGQMTVDEMLASCPQCAGELQDFCLDDGNGGGPMTMRCEDCGWVREPK
jgi:predicted  nucleic acid-binding Zn ribbon protein